MKTPIAAAALAIALPGFAAGMAKVEWTRIYSAADLPDRQGWGASKGENTHSEVTAEGLHLVDAGTAHTELHCYSSGWGARPERGGVVQATVRVVSCTGRSGVCLHASDGVHEDGLTLFPDRIVLSGAQLEYPMETTDAFHTYCLRIAGTNIEVWVDGKCVLDGWGQFVKPAHNGRRLVMFGSISSAATSESVWKDVRFQAVVIPAKRIAGAEDVVIYRREGVYACFPGLYRLSDGRWTTSFGTRVRRSHIDGTGGSARAVSADEGRTWKLTEERFTDPRFLRADGATVVPAAQGWIYVNEEELPTIKKRGRRWMKARKGTVAYLGDPRVRVTNHAGKSTVLELDCPVPGGVMGFHHEASFLRDGNLWLCAIYGGYPDKKRSGVWGIRSDDDGATWGIVEIASPFSVGRGFNETALCSNGRGELIAVMRPRNENMNSCQVFSSDHGLTWTPPYDTGFWGYPSHLLLLRDGRLLCTYGYRRDAMGVRAVLSNDGGHTWDTESEMVIRCDGMGNGGDNGYPISLQKEDGSLFTIYYINDRENVTHVAGTHWSLPPM